MPHAVAMAETRTPNVVTRSLRENFAWMLAGNIVYAGCQWGLLVVLAKLTSPAQVGAFALALATTGPVFVLSQLHLRALQSTDAASRFRFGDYLGLRLLATGVGFLFCVLLALFFPWEAAGSIIAIAASRVFDNLSDVYHGDLQHREQMTRIGASLVMKGPLGLAALAIAIQLTGSVTWASAALALVSALVFVLYDSQSGAGWPKGDRTAYRRLVGIAFPLAVVTALISLNTNVPRYFVEHHRGSGELGIFAALFYLTAAGTTVVTAAGQSISPRLARLYASGDRAGFHRLLWRVTILVCGCGLAGALLIPLGGQRLIALLYRPEYARFGDVLFWILAGTVPMFAASVTGYAITAAQQFRPQVPLFAITTLVTAAGCFWLVPASGMLGAAYAVNLAAAVQLAGSLIILRQAWRRA